MIYQKLLSTIRERLDDMANEWVEEIRKNEYFATYQKFEDEVLKKRAGLLYAKLALWLQSGGDHKQMEDYFFNLGKERYFEGFPLTEVHLALYVTKKIFWRNIDWRDAITGNFNTQHAKAITEILNDYFDLGNFFVTRGYFRTVIKNIGTDKCLNKDEIEKLLCKGALTIDLWENKELNK